jgi:uncharacterized protein (DUF2147 family)
MNDLRTGLAALAAFALAIGLYLSLGFAAHAAPAGDPAFGDWLSEARNGKIRIAPCAANPAQACGTLFWAVPPADAPPGPLHDAKNPDPALRGRPLLGVLIISDFHKAADGQWEDGKIYEPDSGKTYKSKMAAESDGTLKVSGCVLIFCKAQTWTRVAP